MSEYVFLHPDRKPYGGPEWQQSLAAGRLDVTIAGYHTKVRQEGDIDGKPRFVVTLPDDNDALRAALIQNEARSHNWFSASVATAIIVEEAAQKALRDHELALLKQPAVRDDKALIQAELAQVGEALGVIDSDALKLVNLREARVVDGPDGPIVHGVREAVAKLREEKPHHFRGAGKEAELRKPKPTTAAGVSA